MALLLTLSTGVRSLAIRRGICRGTNPHIQINSTLIQARCLVSQSDLIPRLHTTHNVQIKHSNLNHRTSYAVKAPLQAPLLRASASTHASALSTDLTSQQEIYRPPTTGLLSHLPPSWIPYAELIRLDKPTGAYYLFWPCTWSTLMAATLTTPVTAPSSVIYMTALFATGALVMRGAGCTINDLWDRNLDPHVTRTKFRPIARRAISPERAIIFTGFQLFAGLAILLQFPTQCLYYGIPSLALVATYPLAKRVTHYPQVVLGLAFSWGAMMGFPALGIDLLAPENHAALTAAGLLYASNVAWTVLYDIIYAHMDVRDDLKAGIKSIVVAHEKHTKKILTGLAITQLGLLAGAGIAAGCGPVFFVGSVGSAALSLAWMIRRVKLEDVKDCWWWFRYGCWFTGGGVTAGLLGEYLARYLELYEDVNKVKDKEK